MAPTQDHQYEKLEAGWLASQRDGPFNARGLGGSSHGLGGLGGPSHGPLNLGGLGGASHGPRYGEFDQFNQSSIVFPRQSSSTADTVDYILRIVAQADHETLLRSGNEAYANALASHNGTKSELASLQRSFELMVQSRAAPNQTDDDPPRRPSGLAKRLPYRKADYPNINYWTRKNYDDARHQNAPAVILDAAAEMKGLPFMEHEDGTPLTEEEAVKMRATACGIFAHFLHEGTAPAKWGQVSVVGQDFFFNAIAERHPHAAMCEDMWKAQLLATTCYPSWHRNNKEKIERRKQEILWTQQQLEHGRQLKEELMENVEYIEGKMKRDRSLSDANDMPQLKSFKKPRSTNSRVMGSLPVSSTVSVAHNSASQQAPMPTPSIAFAPLPSLDSAGQQEPASAPPTLPALDQSNNQCVLTPTTSTTSEPTVSRNNESQREPTTPVVLSGPIPGPEDWMYDRTELDSTSTYNTALDRLSACDSTPPPNTSEQHTMRDTPSSSASLPSESPFADPHSFDASASDGLRANDFSTLPLPRDENDPHGMEGTSFSSEPILPDPTIKHRAHASSLTDTPSLDAGTQLGTQATRSSSVSPPPDSLDSSRRQASASGVLDAQEATAEALLSLRHDEPLARPRPSPRLPGTTTVPLNFDSTFDKNVRKTGVRNPLGDLMVPHSSATSDTLDLSDTAKAPTKRAIPEIQADKENEGPQPKGRGRPSGKPTDLSQLIKPTKVSATPRNLFALEYKEKNRAFPTEGMWQSLDKVELQRLEALSKEKKNERTKAKSDN